MAVDAKVNIDDNALYRQKKYDMRDVVRKNPIEVEAKEVGLNYGS
jgi:succinyl-CoA synthetase beta subunit